MVSPVSAAAFLTCLAVQCSGPSADKAMIKITERRKSLGFIIQVGNIREFLVLPWRIFLGQSTDAPHPIENYLFLALVPTVASAFAADVEIGSSRMRAS